MGIITDAILALPIGVIYNMIIHEFADIFNEKLNYKDKLQRNLLLIFGGGLIGFLIAYFFTTNNALKYGMYLGSLLLVAHTVLYNWVTMHNDTRIIVMILSLSLLIWFAYNQTGTTESEKDKGVKNKENKIIDESDDFKEEDGMHISSLLSMNSPTYEPYDVMRNEKYYTDNDEIIDI